MARKVKLDFTGVENFQRASEGRHVVKVATADVKQSQGGNDMIVVAFEVTRGEDKGSRVYENFPMTETALWKLKGFLQAIGMKADGKVQLDLDKLIGKALQIDVKHEEYEGKTRARVDQMLKLTATSDDSDDDDDEDEEDEIPEEKPAKKSAKKPQPVEEEDEDDDWDEDEDEEEEPAPKKPTKKSAKPEKKAPKKPVDDDDDDDDWDEE